jgi:hypothetical protein
MDNNRQFAYPIVSPVNAADRDSRDAARPTIKRPQRELVVASLLRCPVDHSADRRRAPR